MWTYLKNSKNKFKVRENFYKKSDVYIVYGEWINMSETFKIINKIEIHQDKQVDLYFNFKQLNNLKEKI